MKEKKAPSKREELAALLLEIDKAESSSVKVAKIIEKIAALQARLAAMTPMSQTELSMLKERAATLMKEVQSS